MASPVLQKSGIAIAKGVRSIEEILMGGLLNT